MPIREINDQNIEFDDEGYMIDRTAWNREIAAALAKEEGIENLTDRHYAVIEFMRKEVEERGVAPSIRRLNKLNIVPTKELYQLFPGGPAKKAARIAGLQKPQGCV